MKKKAKMNRLRCWVLHYDFDGGEFPSYVLMAITTEDGTPIVLRRGPLWKRPERGREFRLARKEEILAPKFNPEEFAKSLGANEENIITHKFLEQYGDDYEEAIRAATYYCLTEDEFKKRTHGPFIVYETDVDVSKIEGQTLHFRRGHYGWSTPGPPPKTWPVALTYGEVSKPMLELEKTPEFEFNSKDLSSIFVDRETAFWVATKRITQAQAEKRRRLLL